MPITPTPNAALDVTTGYQTLLTCSSVLGGLLKGIWVVNYSSSARQVGINIVSTAGTEAGTNALRPYSADTTITAGNVEYWSMDFPLSNGQLVRVKADANTSVTCWAEYGAIS